MFVILYINYYSILYSDLPTYQGDKLEEFSKELENNSLPVETIKKCLTLLLAFGSLGIDSFFFFCYFYYCFVYKPF
jgi:hypothetical protein